MLRPTLVILGLGCALLLLAPSAPLAAQSCSCSYDYGATYCCAKNGYTPETVNCSLNGYQWSCQDRVVSDPYITTMVWAGIGSYCSGDFIDSWVGSTSCSYDEASCSTTTPGVCVWTPRDLYCHVYDRPTESSCGGGGPV